MTETPSKNTVASLFLFRSADGVWKRCASENLRSRAVLFSSDGNEVFCPNHCRWEGVEERGDFSVTTTWGDKFRCICVPYQEFPEYQEKFFPSGKEDEKARDEHLNLVKELKFDEIGMNRDIVGVSVENDRENFSCKVMVFSVPREKLESARPHSYDACNLRLCPSSINFDMKSAKTTGSLGTEILPGEAVSFINEELQRNACRMAGRSLRFAHLFAKVSDGRAYVRTPFELRLFPLVERFKELEVIRNDDLEGYNHLCAFLGIRSNRTLWNLFCKNPFVLIRYKLMLRLGFRDFNVISRMLGGEGDEIFGYIEYPERYESEFYERQVASVDGLCESFSNMAFFCEKSIEMRGEIVTLNAVLRGNDMGRYERNDTYSMFHAYYNEMTEEMRTEVLRDGITTHSHTILGKLAYTLKNKNVIFKYDKAQKKLQDEIEGWKFLLPKDSYTLKDIGMALHNCVASYKESVISKRCTIVYAIFENEFRLCIEVRGKNVHQYRADRNATPSGEDFRIFKIWAEKHKLTWGENIF